MEIDYTWENRPSFLDKITLFNNNEIISDGSSITKANWAILHIKVKNTTKSKISNVYLNVNVSGGAERIYFAEVSSPQNAYEEGKERYNSNRLSIRTSSKNIGPGVNQSWYVVVVSKGEDMGNYTISVNPQGAICSNLDTTTIEVTK